MNKSYVINKFSEYQVDIDLETDSNGFNMVFENTDSMLTGYFNKYDDMDIYVGKDLIMTGSIDTVEHDWDESENVIQVVGRDILSILIDNDAIPTTKNNVSPTRYIKDKLNEYGISNYSIRSGMPVVPKLIIGTGESELSIMNNLLADNNNIDRIWAIGDKAYVGEWDTGAKPKYYFTRGVPANKAGVPIKKLNFRDSSDNSRSEVRIYGSVDDGSEKVVGTAKNQSLINRGIRKRRVLRSYNNDSSSKYASNALRNVRDWFRDDTTLTITIKTGDVVVLPNTTAHVIDSVTKINSIFFIKGVKYRKSLGGGSETTITMIPGDSTFEVIWNSTSKTSPSTSHITGTPSMSLDQLLSTLK
jgi:prophage tail gpP-like protein